jgi:hypothetical protein
MVKVNVIEVIKVSADDGWYNEVPYIPYSPSQSLLVREGLVREGVVRVTLESFALGK